RNTAENAAYQAERQLNELGDSVDDSSKEEIQAAIKDIRDSLESDDVAELQAKTQALQEAFHKVSEQMYAAAAQQQAEAAQSTNGAPTDGAGAGDGEVVDAEAGRKPEPEPDPLAKAEAERDDYLELARRTQADFENYRKRAVKEMAAAGARAKVGLVRDLLPVVDNLERALESAEDSDSGLAK